MPNWDMGWIPTPPKLRRDLIEIARKQANELEQEAKKLREFADGQEGACGLGTQVHKIANPASGPGEGNRIQRVRFANGETPLREAETKPQNEASDPFVGQLALKIIEAPLGMRLSHVVGLPARRDEHPPVETPRYIAEEKNSLARSPGRAVQETFGVQGDHSEQDNQSKRLKYSGTSVCQPVEDTTLRLRERREPNISSPTGYEAPTIEDAVEGRKSTMLTVPSGSFPLRPRQSLLGLLAFSLAKVGCVSSSRGRLQRSSRSS